MPCGSIASLAAARGALRGVHLQFAVHANVATAAAAAPFSLRPLFPRFVPLAVLGAVEQVGEVHPARLALPWHDPAGLLLVQGAGLSASMAAAVVGPRTRRRVLVPPRCSREAPWVPLPLATSMSRSIRAKRGRPGASNTPLAVAPTVANSTNVINASGTLGITYTRAMIVSTPLDGHIRVSRGGAALMPLPSIALLVSQCRFEPVLVPTLALIASSLTASRIGPVRPTLHLLTIPPVTFTMTTM